MSFVSWSVHVSLVTVHHIIIVLGTCHNQAPVKFYDFDGNVLSTLQHCQNVCIVTVLTVTGAVKSTLGVSWASCTARFLTLSRSPCVIRGRRYSIVYYQISDIIRFWIHCHARAAQSPATMSLMLGTMSWHCITLCRVARAAGSIVSVAAVGLRDCQ